MRGSNQATRERLASRADRELARRTLQGSLLPFLLFLLIIIPTASEHADHILLVWIQGGLLLAIELLRAYVSLSFAGLYARRPMLWRTLFKGGTYSTAIVWGFFAAVSLTLHGKDESAWLTLLVTTGLAAGASVSLSPMPSLALHYLLILLVPTTITAALRASFGDYLLAAVIGLFTGFMVLQSRNSSGWFWRAMQEEDQQLARTRELEERTAYLNTLIQESPLATVVLDPQQNIRMCNPAFEQLFQYEQAEIAGRNLDELIHTQESVEENLRLSQQALEGNTIHVTTRRRRKDGTAVDVELHGVPLVQNEKLIGLFAIYEDITGRRESERKLREAHHKLEEQVEVLNQVTGEINALSDMGNFLQCCESVTEAYTVIGRSARSLFSTDPGALCILNPSKDSLEIVAAWGDTGAEQTGFAPKECWAIRQGQIHARLPLGGEPPCWHVAEPEDAATLCIPLMAQGETMGVLHLRSVCRVFASQEWLAARRRVGQAFAEEVALALANLQLREKLLAQSIRDPLTGMFNRRYMEESLDREIRRAERRGGPVSVLMVDLDHFKRFNDTFGHEAGDLLLREMGKLLRQQVRGEDIVCRYGGEEFTVILPDAPLEIAQQRAQQLCAAASKLEVRHQGQLLGTVTLSIGAACHPQHGSTPGNLLRTADRALYEAKAAGRNRVVLASSEKKIASEIHA